jgi:kynureninase
LFCAFYRPASGRTKILIEDSAFPSDDYALQSQLRMHGLDPAAHLVKVPASTEAVLEAIDAHGDQVAIVWLGQVNYLTGYAFDLAAIAARAHARGCLMGVDLAHGIGNLRLQLHDDDVDFATWCSYKYLNAGPGGVSGVYIHERHALNPEQFRLAGWWGHDKASRFEMGPDFRAIPGAEGWQLSNPPIFQLAALRASLDLFDRTGMPRLRRKSEQLVAFLELGLRTALPEVQIATPSDPARRGNQLSLRIPKAPRALPKTLLRRGVICDFREPDVVRVAPVPLYTRFQDVYRLVQVLADVLH